MSSPTLQQKVSEMHERFLQLSDLQKIKRHVDSLLQDLRKAAELASKEQLIISGLVERQSGDYFFGCQPTSFINTFGPIVKSLDKMCQQNNKILNGLETGLLLYFNDEDPLLLHVQNLQKRSKQLSKIVAKPASRFVHYDSRVNVELKWISQFPIVSEICLQQFSTIMPTLIALQKDLSVVSQALDELASCKDASQDFCSKFRTLHILPMTLDSIQSMSRSSTTIVQAVDDICSQCKNLTSVYQEKEIIALGFIGCERFVKKMVSEVEGPLSELHQQVINAKKLYDRKFSRLTVDAKGPDTKVYMYKEADGLSDFSWRFRFINGRSIMPSLRDQRRGQCAYASTMSCTESLYKRENTAVRIGTETYLSEEFILNLSLEHLRDLVDAFCATNSIKGHNTLDYYLEAQGVITEEAYDNAKENFHSYRRYRIKEFEKLNTARVKEGHALLEDGIALIGNFRVTTDYHRLGRNDVYDIPEGATFETNPSGQYCSHCVVIIGYGVTSDGLSYYIFQNSYGKKWGDKGFGRIACSCLKYLYRASV
ncbi:uncharacterized protein [Aegilops tauschii subsp. strangulata]|uniref:uncharacterized protein isoform X2 n=1 Tax=Aegilops tauschii subsp. strangulata TaxID=200361 RepID=UPI00098B8188|nr:uncharacterized protein LOC109744675 isoform X2 [Aegilops tauschii subsp. strangulata]